MNYAIAGFVGSLLVSSPAFSLECHPKDNSARILASPRPNDIHPDWKGEAYVGMSWSFVAHGSAERRHWQVSQGKSDVSARRTGEWRHLHLAERVGLRMTEASATSFMRITSSNSSFRRCQ